MRWIYFPVIYEYAGILKCHDNWVSFYDYFSLNPAREDGYRFFDLSTLKLALAVFNVLNVSSLLLIRLSNYLCRDYFILLYPWVISNVHCLISPNH